MERIRVLDCTLRDGGCVNNFNFGLDNMKTIKEGLELSGIDIIECGYIDEKKGSECNRTQFIDDVAVQRQLLGEKRKEAKYVAMIDYGKFDCKNLQPKSDRTLDGIRIAFHKKNRFDILEMCKSVLEKGYELFIQPMTIMRYTDAEIIELIDFVNRELPTAAAFYIVDSFGEMRMNDLQRVLLLVDNNLNPDIALGFHSHNNLQLSYANAIQVIGHLTKRNIIIDASIMGMGKGAGNLNTELFLDHLNYVFGTDYKIKPLLDLIDKIIGPISQKFKWGYAVEYFLSSKNSCTPSYAQHFYKKHLLSIEQISDLLGKITEEKKISFDEEYAEHLYYDQNKVQIDDNEQMEGLKKTFQGKQILLIAPGQSITRYQDKINELLKRPDVASISLNVLGAFPSDYIFVNKSWLYDKALKLDTPIITLSNIGSGRPDDVVLNYERWTTFDESISENSLQVILNILSELGVTKIYMAGFDGFTFNIDKNYYTDDLKRNLSISQVEDMNQRAEAIIQKFSIKFDFTFVTPSRYRGSKSEHASN